MGRITSDVSRGRGVAQFIRVGQIATITTPKKVERKAVFRGPILSDRWALPTRNSIFACVANVRKHTIGGRRRRRIR